MSAIFSLSAMRHGGLRLLACAGDVSSRLTRASRPLAALSRHRWQAAVVALVGGFLVMLGAPSGSVQAAPTGCVAGTTLDIVAHPDDDLLFLNPSILHDVQCSRRVVTVIATAGDAGQGEPHWSTRELGAEAAYANMAGLLPDSSWTPSTLTKTDGDGNSHVLQVRTLDGAPNISLVFMRLPDGNSNGAGFSLTGFKSLQQLWASGPPYTYELPPVDGSHSYTRPQLVSVLTALMNEYQPDTIRTQDYGGGFGDGDHSDHHAIARFAKLAQQQYRNQAPPPPPFTFTGYLGYGTSSLSPNVTGADLTAKQNAFFAYEAHDTNTCTDVATCAIPEYLDWLQREYVVALPIANAGPDQTVALGSLVALDGSGSSDPMIGQIGHTFSYSWTQTGGPHVGLADANGPTPTFTAPSGATTLTFLLTVNDGPLSDTSSVTITVTPISDLSITKTDGTGSVVTGSSTTYTIRVTNAGPNSVSGAILTDPSATGLTKTSVSCSGDPGECGTPPTTTELEGGSFALPTLDSGEHYELSVSADVTATSGSVSNTASVSAPSDLATGNNSASDSDTINRAPVADAGPDQSANTSSSVQLDGSHSSDPNGDTLTYKWEQTVGPTVTLSSTSAPKPTFTAPKSSASLTFKLTVSDGTLSSSDSVTITLPDRAPVAHAGPDQTVNAGTKLTLDGSSSSDPDSGDALTYLWEQTSGTKVTLSSTTAKKPTFTAPESAGTLTFKLTVSDGKLGSSDSISLKVIKNAGPAVALRPQTKLGKVKISSAKRSATFWFSGSLGNGKLSFQCKLDKGKYKSCSSGKSYKNLKVGKHTFFVRVKDTSGKFDLSPATKRFKI